MKHLQQKIFIGLFLALISAPALLMLIGIQGFVQAHENRNPAEFPSLNTLHKKTFFPSLDKYLADNFALRSDLLWLGWAQVKLLNTSTNSSVIFGKDGWLFYSGERNLDDYRNSHPFTDEELGAWVSYIKRETELARTHGTQYFFMVAPNSHTIYGDLYLPSWIQKKNPLSRTDQLKTALLVAGINLVDPRQRLLKHRLQERLYYKTDTHWTQLGAFYAYQELVESLGMVPRDLSAYRLEKRETEHQDLTNMLGSFAIHEEFMVPVSLTPDRAQTESRARAVGVRNDYFSKCENCETSKRVLVFRDSFMDSLRPFLGEHFLEAQYYWQYETNWSLVDKMKPDFVVHQVVERRLMAPPP